MDWHTVWKVIAGGFVGSGITLGGFYQFGSEYFFKRLSKKYDEEMEILKSRFSRELERLKTQLERSTFVTKAHFDVEFAAYKEIFGALADTRRAIEATRPFFALVPRNAKKEERDESMFERLKDLVTAHQQAAVTVENARPFYEPSIYEQILVCLKAANLEVSQIATANDRKYSFEWYDQGVKNQSDFLAAYGKVADMIRQRIDSLSVLPGS